jgi:hypothetical protein
MVLIWSVNASRNCIHYMGTIPDANSTQTHANADSAPNCATKVRFRGCTGIILCDGNCQIVRSSMATPGGYDDGPDNWSVPARQFIYLLCRYPLGGSRSLCPGEARKAEDTYQAFPKPKCTLSDISQGYRSASENPCLLPAPVNDALNVSHRLEEGSYRVGQSFFWRLHSGNR